MPSGNDSNVCIVGLGYVGLTLAVTMADVGFLVQGVEIDKRLCASLRAGRPHFFEIGLKEQLQRLLDRRQLTISSKIPDDCAATVFIVTVGTPLGADGKVRTDMIQRSVSEIARHLKDGDLVIPRSTLRVGTTRNVIHPILSRTKKRFDLAFCPERTQQGFALRELRELPQIVGGMTSRAALRATALFQRMTPTVLRVSNTDTAEMTKLIDNVSRDVTFAFANETAILCEELGVSAAEVVRAARLAYPRAVVAMPGPVGGPCLTKDSHILLQSVGPHAVPDSLTRTARKINESLMATTILKLRNYLRSRRDFPSAPQISILGFAFKGYPPTDDLRGSTAVELLQQLRKHFPKAHFSGFDPLVPSNKLRELGVKALPDLKRAFRKSNLVVIHNNHSIFRKMLLPSLARQMATPGIIYDFWNQFSPDDFRDTNKVYLTLGSLPTGPPRPRRSVMP